MKKVKGIKKNLKIIRKKIINSMKNDFYIRQYYKENIENNTILIESKNGIDLAGNMFYILKELQKEEYSDYTIYLVAREKNKAKISKLLENYEIKNYKFTIFNSFDYLKKLATSKFLFNDTSFPKCFIKKDGQIYTNTWHGTPLKYLSNQVKDRRYAMGNIKKNFLMSDYLVYPNKEMEEKMLLAYTFENLYKGKILNVGYPRNTVFFDYSNEKLIREKLNLINKKVIVYMPTWRGILNKKENKKQSKEIKNYLDNIDKLLKNNEVFYIKLHPFNNKNINTNEYKHIKQFPSDYESYDFLKIADVLVTDYSSVFFDYAISKRKVILFTYDKEEYIEKHGLYYEIENLPFPEVRNVKSLVKEIRKNNTIDYSQFDEFFATYESADATEKLLQCVINNKNKKISKKLKVENKENILVYSGSLALNGFTSSVKSLFSLIDLEKYNIYASFAEKSMKSFPLRVNELPDDVILFPLCDLYKYTFIEKMVSSLYFKYNITNNIIKKILEKHYLREFRRLYGNANFDRIIHYTGYEKDKINLFQSQKSKKAIYVHNDMIKEIKHRKNQHFLTLKNAYNSYDKVVVVTEAMADSVLQIGNSESNIIEINNFFDEERIKRLSNDDISFDRKTVCNIGLDELNKIVDNKKYKKFINIGRFSKEKGQHRLIDSFDKYYKDNKDTYLIIIGGHGPLFKKLKFYANSLGSKNNIIFIKYMTNPYALLKKCDLFILSSFYEALGLVLIESAVLNVPCFSTDIPGTAEFMVEHGGYLVENSEKGILQGMYDFKDGLIKVLNFNSKEHNKVNLEKFYNMFEKKGVKK